ncbi:MAG TPA: hypothetical protein VIK14_16415 [Ignavibacteria bacterium]
MKNLITVLLLATLFISCKEKKDNSENLDKRKDSLDIISKELSIKEKELELKQKELDFEKEKEKKSESNTKYSFNYYANPRFGFSMSYPSNFTKDRPPDNGDGQIFRSPDRKFMLLGSGSYYPSALDKSIDEIYNESIPNYDQVTYKVLESDWFVISGYDKGKIFYTKSFLRNGTLYTILMEYPESEKDKYDDLVNKLSKSFKVLN